MSTVLVTRPAHQAGQLTELLERQGVGVVRLPLIEIIPVEVTHGLMMDNIQPLSIDWIIFISANAVNFALSGNNGKIRAICQQTKVAAVGQSTAKALDDLGIFVSCVPDQGFNSEALLASPILQRLHGQFIVIVRGVGGRALLADTLRQRGAQVTYLEVYKRQLPKTDPVELITRLKDRSLDVVTITSAEALYNLLTLLPDEILKQLLFACSLVVISDRLKEMALALGFKTVYVSDGVSDHAVFNTIIALVSGEESGRIK